MKRSIIDDERSSAMRLSAEELQRYSRHLLMPEVTSEGQKRLKAARILCIGAGGLGSPTALYLAAAGVGTIGIVDFDDVDLSNRDWSHSTTWSWMGRTIFRRDICPTTSAFLRKGRMFTARFFVSRVKQRCSRLTWVDRAIAAFSRSRLHRTQSRTARKQGCSVFYLE